MQLTLTPSDRLQESLDIILSHKKLEYVTEQSIIFYGKYPVRIKATIEKLMNSGELKPGTVIQYNNAVRYTPTGHFKFYDVNGSI